MASALVSRCWFPISQFNNSHRCLTRNFYSTNKSQKNVFGYIGSGLSMVLKVYENFLQKRFPRFFQIYLVFRIGTVEFSKDMKSCAFLFKDLLRGKKNEDFTRLECEKLYQFNKDCLKVSPTLLIASLPFANWIMLPLAYKYPRRFLSHHFWSAKEKAEFAEISLCEKLKFYSPILRHLQDKLGIIREPELKNLCADIINKVGSGVHPTARELIQIRPLFMDSPYELKHLVSSHLQALCEIHELSPIMPLKQKRLFKKASSIYFIDRAMKKEGVGTLTLDELKYACYFRGLNPIGLSEEEIRLWLENWVEITTDIRDKKMVSFLLHCQIFLAHNHSSNLRLIQKST